MTVLRSTDQMTDWSMHRIVMYICTVLRALLMFSTLRVRCHVRIRQPKDVPVASFRSHFFSGFRRGRFPATKRSGYSKSAASRMFNELLKTLGQARCCKKIKTSIRCNITGLHDLHLPQKQMFCVFVAWPCLPHHCQLSDCCQLSDRQLERVCQVSCLDRHLNA